MTVWLVRKRNDWGDFTHSYLGFLATTAYWSDSPLDAVWFVNEKQAELAIGGDWNHKIEIVKEELDDEGMLIR